MRLALPLAIAALLLGLLAGCGGGSSSTGGEATQGAAEGPPGATAEACGVTSLRVSGVSCAKGEGVLAAWRAAPGCRVAASESHSSCGVRDYLCISAQTGKGTAVSCAQPGESIFFIEPK